MRHDQIELEDKVAELALEQLDEVSGGESIENVARIAENTCGKYRVASVSETGFTCK
jgi:S-ribosylhomocysteine lyase LuxS involved in autoinducer biosynthesis